MSTAAKRMILQLEELLGFDEHVSLDGCASSGFEVTIHYWGPEGMTHFHTPGRTLPEAVDRAFRRRIEMRATPRAGDTKGDGP